jgi:hypothetical protein
MQPEQTVSEMVEEVLGSQAKILAEHTGQSLEGALEAVSVTSAGCQLRELAQGRTATREPMNGRRASCGSVLTSG